VDSLRVMLPISTLDVVRRGLAGELLFSPAFRVAQQWTAQQQAAESGSNAWAITSPKSSSGNAMLLANPHLPWSDEFRWVEAHLSGPDVNLYGATFIGLPVITIGFAESHGWTHTVNTQDSEDHYELTLTDGGYLFDGETRSFTSDTLAIRVLQEDGSLREEPFVRLESEHGPVIAHHGDRALARRAIDAPSALEQWWAMGLATSMEEFEDALRMQQLVGFTTTYADREGNILHHYGAATPRRPVDDRAFWQGVVPGNTAETLWHDQHEYDEYPRVANPRSGWVQNANEASYWATWPLAFDLDAFPQYFGPRSFSFRTQRSIDLLDTREQISFEEMVRRKHDTRVVMADRVLDDLIAAAREDGGDAARRAADVLEAWDRTTEAGSVGAPIFALWAHQLSEMAQQQGRSLFAVPWTIEQPRTTPSGLGDPATAVAALEAVASQIEDQVGDLAVPWGTLFRLRLDDVDLPASGGAGHLGVFRVLHFQPDNDGRYRAFFGDGFTLAVEFGDAVRAEAVMPYGNATEANSPHRADQLRYVSEQRLRPVWFTREDVEANMLRRTLLD